MAVIIILAVIALIATPIVLNVIENSRKESYKNSTYGILDAAKLYYTESLIDSTKTGIDGRTNLMNSIKITGKKPDSGILYISNTGLTAIAARYSDYCFKKEFNEQDLTEVSIDNCNITAESGVVATVFGGTYVAATTNDTHKGIVYLNPKDLTATCNETLANQNVNEYGAYTGIKSGCMRFYIFDDSGTNYTMILDHNTSGDVSWNSNNDNTTMNEVATRLSEDTTGWVGSPRLITESEVRTITNNTDTSTYYFGSNGQTNYSSQTIEQKTIQQSYYWLFNNLYLTVSAGGGTIDDNNQYPNANSSNAYVIGYWTSDAVSNSSSYIWGVYRNGSFGYNDANTVNYYGVRPVITIAKSQLQ